MAADASFGEAIASLLQSAIQARQTVMVQLIGTAQPQELSSSAEVRGSYIRISHAGGGVSLLSLAAIAVVQVCEAQALVEERHV